MEAETMCAYDYRKKELLVSQTPVDAVVLDFSHVFTCPLQLCRNGPYPNCGRLLLLLLPFQLVMKLDLVWEIQRPITVELWRPSVF
jgi:hypothetical protein